MALLDAFSKGRLNDQEKSHYLELCAGYPLLIELVGGFHSTGTRRKKLFSGEEYRSFISKKTDVTEKFFAVTGLIRDRIKVFNPRWPGDYLTFGITMWVLASFEHAKVYLLLGDVQKTKAMAEEAENMREDYFLKAIEYYDRSFNILETREISAGLYSWLTLYGNMLCHYWLDDIEKTAGYLVKLESAVPKIKESLGEGHSILSDIEKMRDWIDGAT